MIVADTSGLLILFNDTEPQHDAVVAAIAADAEPPVVSPYVVAELDYLVMTRFGVEAELAVLDEVASGSYEVAALDATDIARARNVIRRYRDQNIGVTDASLVVLAERYDTRTVLTLDHRHFNVVRPLQGGHFRLLP